MEIENEIDSMLVISRWLQNFNVEVWWNQKNEEFQVFHTTGKNRSDLLICYKNKYYIIECKKSDHKKNVYDAFFQTLNYAKDETKYFINNDMVTINGFVIGTDESINGRLFNSKYDVLMTEKDFGESRMVGVNKGDIPKTEYSMTEAICRLLWRGIPEFNIKVPIGVLVSDILNNRNVHPLLLMKQDKQQYMEILR